MSIIPVIDEQRVVSATFAPPLWDPFKNLMEELLEPRGPFTEFPFDHFPSLPRGFFPSSGHQIQINWKETPRAHVLRAYLPGLTADRVIVFLDDDRMLQISTDDGKMTSRFKLPDNAVADQINATMSLGMLTVTMAKELPLSHAPSNSVRVVEITGSDD